MANVEDHGKPEERRSSEAGGDGGYRLVFRTPRPSALARLRRKLKALLGMSVQDAAHAPKRGPETQGEPSLQPPSDAPKVAEPSDPVEAVELGGASGEEESPEPDAPEPDEPAEGSEAPSSPEPPPRPPVTLSPKRKKGNGDPIPIMRSQEADASNDADAEPRTLGSTAPPAQPPDDASVIPFPRPPPPVHRATLQMLPGRLIPMNAKVVQQEIRFLRSANREPSVTLGWEQGEPPEHITLHHPSIQLRHARMRYMKGHWWIETLVEDDPVLLNGSALTLADGRRHLKNGDLVRLGQAEFRFLMP